MPESASETLAPVEPLKPPSPLQTPPMPHPHLGLGAPTAPPPPLPRRSPAPTPLSRTSSAACRRARAPTRCSCLHATRPASPATCSTLAGAPRCGPRRGSSSRRCFRCRRRRRSCSSRRLCRGPLPLCWTSRLGCRRTRAWRTMGRLWGLLGLYSAVKALIAARKQQKQKQTDSLSDESAEKTFAALVAWAQTLCLVVFQVCENAAYLGSKKILPIKPLNQGRLAILSVRFWGAYVAMEVVKHLTERARRLSATASGGVKTAAEEKRWQEDWRTAFYRNAAWAPLTMHWGTPGGLLPDVLVALFALYPATGGMRDLWRRTA
ncbi:hypothetical protein BBAD15_g5046 [Beauveria bassiana D1-5]|uniref:Uncharacterized protein n=1 Tax=Beauveria bassiana D1-5 TaxID=1245745 RepID=A0A0A2VP00_BEABA|nr:hypothetical protein BBAD15_g5046 [Beauveria bassiana D1-5]